MNFKFIKKKFSTIKVALHAVLLLVATLMLQSNYFPIGDEPLVIKCIDEIDHYLLGKQKVNPSDYLFLNTYKSKRLIPAYDDEGTRIVGHSVITDREEIIALLNLTKQGGHDYLLIDIFFDQKTESDSALEVLLKAQSNAIIPYHIDDSGKVNAPVINGRIGLADIKKVGGLHYKYSIFQNHRKTIPLIMYEDLHKTSYSDKILGGTLNNKWVLNDFILESRIRQYSIISEKKKHYVDVNNHNNNLETGQWVVYDLGAFIDFAEPLAKTLMKDKIIIVGDFIEDTHQTLTESEMAGSLILVNAYLALVNGDNVISVWLLLYLIVAYIFLSWIILDPDGQFKQLIKGVEKRSKIILGKTLIIFILLTLVSSLCYFFFGMFMSIFFIWLYVVVLDTLISILKKIMIMFLPK